MANGHGGKRPGSGRKSKAEELGLKALLDECWTPAARRACVRKLSKLAAKGDLKAIELLMAYTFGKPRQAVDLAGADGEPLVIGIRVIAPGTREHGG